MRYTVAECQVFHNICFYFIMYTVPYFDPQVISSYTPLSPSLLLLTQLPPLQANGSFQVVLHFIVGLDHIHSRGASSPAVMRVAGHDDDNTSRPASTRNKTYLESHNMNIYTFPLKKNKRETNPKYNTVLIGFQQFKTEHYVQTLNVSKGILSCL